MTCIKCQGLMVFVKLFDYFDSCLVCRCINCGAVIDKTIAENRRRLRPVKSFRGANHTRMARELADCP